MNPDYRQKLRWNPPIWWGMILCTLPLAMVSGSCNRSASETETLTAVLDSIGRQYAPDTRLAVFEVSARADRDVIRVAGEVSVPEAREAITNYLENLSTPVESGIRLLPDTSAGEKIFGLINLSVANIRSAPGHRSEMVTQAIMGTPVKVLKVQDDWVLIQTPDRYLGWTDPTALARCKAGELEDWNGSAWVIYTDHSGFIWDLLHTDQPISDITAGGMVKLTGESVQYFLVELPDGRRGSIRKTEAALFDSWTEGLALSGEAIVETATFFLGHPYLWGGTSIRGFDCSGFTKTVYFLNGIILPRDADQQSKCGENVSTGNNFEHLRPGDLLFFGSPPPGGGEARITHTGIYTGNLQFIHSAGRVWLDSFDPCADNFNEARLNTLVKVRRILLDGRGINARLGDETMPAAEPAMLIAPLQATLITSNEFYR